MGEAKCLIAIESNLKLSQTFQAGRTAVHRFLIHKVAEYDFPDVFSFSIGAEESRRLVVAFESTVLRQLRKSDLQSSELLQGLREKLADKLGSQDKADDRERKGRNACGIYRPPRARLSQKQSPSPSNSTEDKREDFVGMEKLEKPHRKKRPDIQVYVPRARRLQEAQKNEVSPECKPLQKETNIDSSVKQIDIDQFQTDANSDLIRENKRETKSLKVRRRKSPGESSSPLRLKSPRTPMRRNKEVQFGSCDVGDNDGACNKSSEQNVKSETTVVKQEPCAQARDSSLLVDQRDSTCSSEKMQADDKDVPLLELESKSELDCGSEERTVCNGSDHFIATPVMDIDMADNRQQMEVPTDECNLFEKQQPVSAVDDEAGSIPKPRLHPPSPKEEKREKPEDSENEDPDSWEKLFDDSGDCLNPALLEQLTLAVGDVEIDAPKFDYYEYEAKDPTFLEDDLSHVLEIYQFPAEFRTEDLISAFSSLNNQGFNVKWVDDTHALGIFDNPVKATEALAVQHPLMKVRPLSKATQAAKNKAKKLAPFLQPMKPRPQTSAALARRLVGGALGVRIPVPKQLQDQERKQLIEAKERKKQAARQREDAWEGRV
ncbi:unnamed protein product [Darwinula stevensoni]|uniref:Uncharacterized protein n=1 Tax=Darwinula stevensoni TaxID=69355 RepID=A0A7R8X9B8_9CRUS|nr:unnamed protein product [Darwinula stevensoni]CAG0890953.1 unnamed protein product [Darwinula stevensoni]